MGEKEASQITINSKKYYYTHPEECSYYNWIIRMIAFLDFGKMVWPEPSKEQIGIFTSTTNYRRKRWSRRK